MVAINSSDPIHAAEDIDGLHENHEIADLLREIAVLLEEQHASEFRLRAYRAAADTIAGLPSPIRALLDHDGITGLVSLPTIGHSTAALVETYLRIGHMPLLDRLRGVANAEAYFTTLPGIGPELSHRIYDTLHVETLPELFAAAKQGRLKEVSGLGRKRIQAIMESLQSRTSSDAAANYADSDKSIPIAELLSIDREYRQKAEDDSLPKVAPKNFNPGKVAWLSILHTHRDNRNYTALYSNTEQAHQRHTTRDWVIIYRDDTDSHGRWTVITSQFGELQGRRIVRGREDECKEYYRNTSDFHQPDADHPPHAELPTKWEEDEGRRGIHG
ncbi:helix-hairpin-helix domain-containing protein [Rubripirellula reticaptiva]|uniref:DNA polymerase/3'-5' exonuclease PolX n=1 Tax=Rubripirellula reticaptiva TaxID=2528013 RepID=A0A5C6EG45_9BACT|nr:helix-hairpin-helix domain-containing protein [Rubripirellula reticaptiva]TWU46691.1 DNA polymerase/3'-5' exonuclease PolX [Rubripirellula reticaptiva]